MGGIRLKSILVSLSLLSTALLFAAPAAAVCQDVAETGTSACANAYDAGNWDASASQTGVGFVSANAYEFTFFGQTQRGHNVFLMTDASGPAGWTMIMVGESCFGATGPVCSFQDVSAMAFTPAGFSYAGLSMGGDSRALCYAVADQWDCQEF